MRKTQTLMAYKTKENETSTCLECGQELKGRTDKKFCCMVCKNEYNNRKAKEYRYYKNKVITWLTHNHTLLDGLLKQGRTSADLAALELQGFVPHCFTGCKKGRHTHDEYACFDIRYNLSEIKVYNIRRVPLRILP